MKTITLDGAVFTITPLTLEQVDWYITPLEKTEMDMDAYKLRGYQMVCWSFNNMLPANSPDIWTPERIRKELDLVSFEALTKEILSFSGLKFQNASPELASGESGAVAPTALN